ncbi:MAG: hypothetical protein ABJC13_25365 [Acidobacteriota bacterium]
MIFLIEYNRSEGLIVTFRDFDDSRRREAEESRLEIELDLNRKGVDHEVVLLEASSKAALQRTHQRYFKSLHQLLISGSLEMSAASRQPGRLKGRIRIGADFDDLPEAVLAAFRGEGVRSSF